MKTYYLQARTDGLSPWKDHAISERAEPLRSMMAAIVDDGSRLQWRVVERGVEDVPVSLTWSRWYRPRYSTPMPLPSCQQAGPYSIQQRGQHEDWRFVTNPPYGYDDVEDARLTAHNLRVMSADDLHFVEYRVVLVKPA